MTDFVLPSLSRRVIQALLAIDCVLITLSSLLAFGGQPELSENLASASSLVIVVNGIFILRWIYRSHRNLDALGAKDLKFSHGGTVGWWFVPIANLIKVPKIMDEIADNSKPAQPLNALVMAWWGCWLMANVMHSLGPKIEVDLSHASNAFELASAVFLFKLVAGVDAAQTALRDAYDPSTAAP